MSNIKLRLSQALTSAGIDLSNVDAAALDSLLRKIDFLDQTGRYRRLLSDLFASNDKSNIRSLILEVTFAFQFESKSLELCYEVRQTEDNFTSVDFLRKVTTELSIYLELRLVQQQQKITRSVEAQISEHGCYGVLLGTPEAKSEIVRLQRILLGKVQDDTGNPIKFFRKDPGVRNVVVAEVTELYLGQIDRLDCLLATYGDPAVPDFCRLGVFGLFQQSFPPYPEYIQERSSDFSHFRNLVHGVLFLRKIPTENIFSFELAHCLIPNNNLLTAADAKILASEVANGLLPWNHSPNNGVQPTAEKRGG